MNYDDYKLTEKEFDFLNRAAKYAGNGFKDLAELAEVCYECSDDYTCFTMKELVKEFTEYNEQQIGGFLSSLIQKNALWFEDRKDDRKWDKQMVDLYWFHSYFYESVYHKNSKIS